MAAKRQTSAKGKTLSKQKGALRDLKPKKDINDEHARSIKGSGWAIRKAGG